MAVNVELWQETVKEELFKSNEFLNTMRNADEYVVGGRIVHIPQSGGPSGVEKNRSSVPATVVQRNDTDITYPLHEYTTNPRLITNIDRVELSYDKMASVINEDTGRLMEVVGDNILYDCAVNVPTAGKIATTGADAAATAEGATGTRKIITEADLRAAKKYMDKQNVSKRDRFVILDPEMMDQLMSDNRLFDTYQRSLNIAEGKFGRLFGFQIIERSTVFVVDASQALKVPGTAGAATDAAAAFFYQKGAVERALGDIRVFEDDSNPEYYGDIVSFLVRAGSRNNRADNKGYGIIYRAA
jgi:hypothetical protein